MILLITPKNVFHCFFFPTLQWLEEISGGLPIRITLILWVWFMVAEYLQSWADPEFCKGRCVAFPPSPSFPYTGEGKSCCGSSSLFNSPNQVSIPSSTFGMLPYPPCSAASPLSSHFLHPPLTHTPTATMVLTVPSCPRGGGGSRPAPALLQLGYIEIKAQVGQWQCEWVPLHWYCSQPGRGNQKGKRNLSLLLS